MAIPLLGTGVKLSAHVDVHKNDEHGNPSVLVSTTRPCAECGLPLKGLIVNVNQTQQAHVACRTR